MATTSAPKVATALLFASVAAILSTPSVAFAAECTPSQIYEGGCVDAGLGDGAANLEGSGGTPGGGPGDAGSGTPTPSDPLDDCLYLLEDRCLAPGPGRATPVQPITWADIAQFRPDPGIQIMEPDGWAVIGLDTNFYATTSTQVVQGTLLGHAAAVRFTPVSWTWSYGDGSIATSSTGGASWASLGIPEFDPTPTSHVYDRAGNYVIDLTVEFAAEYQLAGTPWIPIAGTLAVPTNRLAVTSGDATTVLVDRDCARNPSGPGC